MSALQVRGPRVRELSDRQMQVVLNRNNIGRLALVVDGRIELQPIHYVFADAAIYGRTAVGTKYLGLLMQPDVVFEVDESNGLFDWRSVIVRGKVSILRARGPRAEPFAYWNAVAALQRLVPDAFKEGDPVPQRSVVFRLQPHEMTGREARMH